MKPDINIEYTVEDFLDDNRRLRAVVPPTGPVGGLPLGPFVEKYGASSAPARRARFALVNSLTSAYDSHLEAAGLIRVGARGRGTSQEWLAFALQVRVPPDCRRRPEPASVRRVAA